MVRDEDTKRAQKPDSARSERDARLKAALKANMQRRKAQARARGASKEQEAPPASGSDKA